MTKPTLAPLAPLNLGELDDIARALQPMVGARFQEFLHAGIEVGLGFYDRGEEHWLWFDLDPKRPIVVRLPAPLSRKKIQRPLGLFLRSRFLGRRLASVRADLARGRVLVFGFHRSESEQTDEPIEIEAHLVPHATNLIARDAKSLVAENKPKDLPKVEFHLPPESERRSWEEIESAWSGSKSPRRADPAAAEREWSRALEKKRQAVEQMNEVLALSARNESRELGEWLKTHATLEVPEQWRALIDRDRSLAWNIESSFRRAKGLERKAEGTKARIAKVQAEIEALEVSGPKAKPAPAQAANLLAQADARGRSLKLAPDLDCYIGKSAADNMALLRRAQPFDVWLHLRERPGSHAIIRRTRGRNITDAEFIEAGRWVAAQSFGRKISEMKGEKFDLLIVECRFVKPIKGDKLGRVHYTNDRVLRLVI